MTRALDYIRELLAKQRALDAIDAMILSRPVGGIEIWRAADGSYRIEAWDHASAPTRYSGPTLIDAATAKPAP